MENQSYKFAEINIAFDRSDVDIIDQCLTINEKEVVYRRIVETIDLSVNESQFVYDCLMKGEMFDHHLVNNQLVVNVAPIKIANGICFPSVVQIERSEDISKVLGYKDNGTFQSLSPRGPNTSWMKLSCVQNGSGVQYIVFCTDMSHGFHWHYDKESKRVTLQQHEDDSFISNESNRFVQDYNRPLKVNIAPKMDCQGGYFVQFDSSSDRPLKFLPVTQMTTLFDIRGL